MSRGRYRAPRAPGAILGFLFMLLVAWRIWQEVQHTENLPPPLTEQQYDVARAIDGDTLLLANRARVRLIGVDAPETVKPEHPVEPWGPEASEFTRHFVAGGRVRLQFDKERLDRYNRVLAYVWVEDRLLNEELVRAGLARAELGYNYSPTMKNRFRKAEAAAKAAHRGIWSMDQANEPPAAAAGEARK